MDGAARHGFRVLENEWITLADGTRLAARIWLPDGAAKKPVPAILEYLPYRKRDGTTARDQTNYPVFAEAGYAGVRVDIRGSGESEGLFDDEYSPRELAEGCEVINWIAAQPWCTGAVGMMGISWGGFNSLQIAALRPKPLKAVISIASTLDRFNDDIHYKNGCHLSAQLSWSGTMLAYSSRPPDPLLVGNRWGEIWRERLEHEPWLLDIWLRHQTRDAYWQHGSIAEDYAAIEAAVLIIAGWADGYRNAPPSAAAHLRAPVKAINGPWVHKYPHFAWPKPRADFHAEAIRWWDRWLKGKKNGADKLPAYRAYITEGIRPSTWRAADPGRWVAEKAWPAKAIKPRVLHLNPDRTLDRKARGEGVLAIKSPQDTGTASGEWFTLKPDGELAGDQRGDDAGSLVFETAVLPEAIEILGRPVLRLPAAIDAPTGNLIARLLDVHPDGVATRVSFGTLNLAHRGGNAHPRPMTPGESEPIEIRLDECGHRFRAGHRLRLAISTAYWPMVLPPPTAVTATLKLGASATLELPVRKGGDSIEMPEPANPDPLPKYRELAPGAARRAVERDLNKGMTRYFVHEDSGAHEVPDTSGLVTRESREETFTIAADDPLSAVSETRWVAERSRGAWSIRTVTTQRLTANATHFLIEARLEAYEGASLVIERRWNERVRRELM